MELVSNLSDEKIDLLREELHNIPAVSSHGTVSVIDLSLPHAFPLSGQQTDIVPAPPPTDAPLSSIAERWELERRRQSFQITGDPDSPVIAGGGEDGAMYGFFRWLHDRCGCRWFTLSDEDNLTGLEPRTLPDGLVSPATVWRGYEGALSRWDTSFLKRLMQWMLRNGWNLLLFNAAQWAERTDTDEVERLADLHCIRLVIGAHAAEHFLPETVFDSHPEFFALRDGQRSLTTSVTFPDIPGQTHNLPAQPCYGNPEARSFIARRIADFIDSNTALTAFSLWPHDGANNWCECPDCACDTPYRLMHSLAREVLTLTQRPVPIEVLAYSNLLTPPNKGLAPEPRIYTLFCPYLRHYQRRFDAPGFPPDSLRLGRGWPAPQPINPVDDREYGLLFREWLPYLKACRSGLGIFAYYQLAFVDQTGCSDRSRFLYHPDLTLIADELRVFHSEGMGTFYDCSWPLPGFWPDARYAAVLGKLLWNPQCDAVKLSETYYSEAFGKDGNSIMNTLETVNSCLNAPGRPPVPTETLDEAARVFQSAGSPASERYLLWLEYIRLADRSRQALTAGDRAMLSDAEDAIQKLFERNEELLQDRLQTDWMIRMSKGYASEILQG